MHIPGYENNFRTTRQLHKGDDLIDYREWSSLEYVANLPIDIDKIIITSNSTSQSPAINGLQLYWQGKWGLASLIGTLTNLTLQLLQSEPLTWDIHSWTTSFSRNAELSLNHFTESSLDYTFKQHWRQKQNSSTYQKNITLKIFNFKHQWMQPEKQSLFLEPQQSGDRLETSSSGEKLTYQVQLCGQHVPCGLIFDPHTLKHNCFYFLLWQTQNISVSVCNTNCFPTGWFSPCGDSCWCSIQIRLF